jgi:large repetitive protein
VGWARASLDSPATGTTIVDIYKNGSTIFTTPTHRPALASGQNSVLASGIDVPAFVAGDYFTFDVVQLGSSPGADLTVQIGGLPILGDPAAVGSANYREVVLADSPLAYWRLGESSGTSAVDETGNGHTATYHGSPTLGATGALAGDANTAVTFDGVNDYVDCAIDLSAQNQLTIECWLKVSSFADNDHLLCEYTPNFNTDNVGGFIANPNSSSDSKFDLGMHSNSSNYVLRNFTRPSTGAFHHLVLRYDRIATPDATVNAVVDGTVVTMGGLSTTPLGDNFGNSTLYIMSRAGASLFLAGTLDEFAIYGGLLSDARALAHYNAGIGA